GEMEKYRKEVSLKLGPPTQNPFAEVKNGLGKPGVPPAHTDQPGALQYHEILQGILWNGWPKEDKEIGRWLDLLFDGKWAEQIRAAAKLPLGLVQDPRLTFLDTANELYLGRDIAEQFVGRALQLAAQGGHAGAIDIFGTVLALSRQ